MAATQEQLRGGFERWLRENPDGLMERGRNHSQTHWPKEWEAAGYLWFSPPLCPLCGNNMRRASHRAFSLDNGTETTIITFNCKNAHKPPEQAFRSLAGEVAKPIGGGRGRGGVYELERDGKVLRTRSQASAAAVVAHQKKRRAAREAAEYQERVERYGPEVAENWPNLKHGDKLSLAWHRTPERHKQWAVSVGQAQRRPDVKAVRSKLSRQMWAAKKAQEAADAERLKKAEQDAIEARRVADEADRRLIELREKLSRRKSPEEASFVEDGGMTEEKLAVFARLFTLPQFERDARRLLRTTSLDGFTRSELQAAARAVNARPASERPTVAARHFVAGKTGKEYSTVAQHHREYLAWRDRKA